MLVRIGRLLVKEVVMGCIAAEENMVGVREDLKGRCELTL